MAILKISDLKKNKNEIIFYTRYNILFYGTQLINIEKVKTNGKIEDSKNLV